MKRTLLFLALVAFTAAIATAQDKVVPNKPFTTLNSEPGYITINEFTGGVGLGVTNVDFSKYFFGFTTIHGYQVNKNFIVGGGTGVSVYNGGTLVPLFADIRYGFSVYPITPYVFGDAGLLLNFGSFNGGTRMFINPGIGGRYAFSRNLAANAGVGLFIQMGEARRDAFINFKLGLTFKPN